MLVLMLMSMLMSHASVDLFVLSFVLPCAYAYVASENQALCTYSLTLTVLMLNKFTYSHEHTFNRCNQDYD